MRANREQVRQVAYLVGYWGERSGLELTVESGLRSGSRAAGSFAFGVGDARVKGRKPSVLAPSDRIELGGYVIRPIRSWALPFGVGLEAGNASGAYHTASTLGELLLRLGLIGAEDASEGAIQASGVSVGV